MNSTNTTGTPPDPVWWKTLLEQALLLLGSFLTIIGSFRLKNAEVKVKAAEGVKTEAEADKVKREGRQAEDQPVLDYSKTIWESGERNWKQTQDYLMKQNESLSLQLAQANQNALNLTQDRIKQDAQDQQKRELSLQQLQDTRDELHKALLSTADASKLLAGEQQKNQDLVKKIAEDEMHHRQRLGEEIAAKEKAVSDFNLIEAQAKALKSENLMLQERLERMKEKKTDVKDSASG